MLVGKTARKSGKGPDKDDEAAQISFSVFLALAAGQFPVSGLERTPKQLCKACSNRVPKKEYRATVVVTSHPPLQGRAIKLGLPASFYETGALKKAMAVLKKEYEAQDFTKINSRIAEMPFNEDWKLLPFGESVKTGFPHRRLIHSLTSVAFYNPNPTHPLTHIRMHIFAQHRARPSKLCAKPWSVMIGVGQLSCWASTLPTQI